MYQGSDPGGIFTEDTIYQDGSEFILSDRGPRFFPGSLIMFTKLISQARNLFYFLHIIPKSPKKSSFALSFFPNLFYNISVAFISNFAPVIRWGDTSYDGVDIRFSNLYHWGVAKR